MSQYLSFVDFPDPDNFLLVLELAKKCDCVDVVLTGRPVDLSYAPSYPSHLDFNFDKFAINDEHDDLWFAKHEVNEEDTELVFKVNTIRLYKFIQQCGIDTSKVRLFRSDKVDLPLKFKHHMHKQEWKFDLEDKDKKIIDSISWKTDNALPGELVDENGYIIRSAYNRDKIVNVLQQYIDSNEQPVLHALSELNKHYDAFLVAGPFTDVKTALDDGVATNRIVAMAGAVRTGTVFGEGEPRPNLFPDQFNIYAGTCAAKVVFQYDSIPLLLIPTEATKSWGPNKHGFVFTAQAIEDSGPVVTKLFKEYYGDPLKGTYNVFDLVAGRYLLHNSTECTQPVEGIYIDSQGRFIIKCIESKEYQYEESETMLIRTNPNDCIVVGNMYPTDTRITKSSVFELFTCKLN